MALGYGQLSFNDIYNELNAYGGYGNGRSARAMAAHAGFGTPDAVSDFHGYTTPAPEVIENFTAGYNTYDIGYGFACGDYFTAGITSLGRYVYGGDVSQPLNGNFALENQYYNIYAIYNGYLFHYVGYCEYFL